MIRLVNVELENTLSRKHLFENIPGEFEKVIKISNLDIEIFVSSFKLFYVKTKTLSKEKNVFVYLHDCPNISRLIRSRDRLKDFKLKSFSLFNQQREICLLNRVTSDSNRSFFVDIYSLYLENGLDCILPYVIINPFKISYKNEKVLSF